MHRKALVLAILGVSLMSMPARADDPPVRAAAEGEAAKNAMPDLHKKMMDKYDSMNAAGDGIFHHDITPALANYFPVGQPMAETKKIIAEQKLGELKPFKGINDPGMGEMFVTKFDLVGHVFSHVYVVIDFDFDGPPSDMKIKMMKAYLRASNM